MNSNDIRQAFLDFFAEKQHEKVSSSPLPQKDNPTLLFTNAGMNQFANVFLGLEKRPYNRAVTSQKVMRVSGKHNDLENVGPSPRHHTFFEMLGNFSFGDYFKKEAIAYSWEFLTGKMGLDPQRLWVSIYTDDDESFDLWQAHVPADRILRFGKEENFWEMGDVGPCGPCSEIHYYLGDLDQMTPAGVNVEDDYLEVWNLVFMQYEKDEKGVTTPLPRPSIDTGMGLERIALVKQGAKNTYDTDLFQPAFQIIQMLLEDDDEEREEKRTGYRVIADHVRAATFLIADGVRPGNDGAAYVLRMVIRRAAKFGREIGFDRPFMAHVAQSYIDYMSDAYPELRVHADHIKHTLTQEEERFSRTLDNALVHLDKVIAALKQKGESEIPGDVAFNLYATHGLPVEITRDIAGDQGVTVDQEGFLTARQDHSLASGEGKFKEYTTGDNIYSTLLKDLISEGKIDPTGVKKEIYTLPRLEAQIVAILRNDERRDVAREGDRVEVVTAATPFYVESGGQISDVGTITDSMTGGQMKVLTMSEPFSGLVIHVGEVVRGELRLGSQAMLRVDDERRADIRRNHTATHVLHEELRRRLGTHVTQAGSLVAPDRLRFDFTHGEAVDRETLREIEASINETIMADHLVTPAYMGQKEAIGQGAMALFGEKYGDIVRTIKIGDGDSPYSFELCGGLHVSHTGDINLFHILSEGSVSAGVRRIEAVTGRAARAYFLERLDLLNRVSSVLGTRSEDLEARVSTLISENKGLQKELDQLRKESLVDQLGDLLQQTQNIDGVNLLTAIVDDADTDSLRELTDRFRDKTSSGVAVLGTVKDDRPLLVAMVTQDLVEKGVHAGNLVREAAKIVGGGGGGRPNMAQAGGKNPEKLATALDAVPEMIRQMLNR